MESSPLNNNGEVLESRIENFLQDDSFQTLPTVLLKDLRRKDGSGKNVLEHLDITVYALLKSHALNKGDCHPSLERLAALAACSASTIQRSLRRLESAGHIQRKSHNKGKIFMLTDVAANAQIVRKKPISFAPRRRKDCPMVKPEPKQGIPDGRQGLDSEFQPISLSEYDLPTAENETL